MSDSTCACCYLLSKKYKRYLLDLTRGDHTWARRAEPPACGQWSGFGPMSGWMGTDHHAHRISERQTVQSMIPPVTVGKQSQHIHNTSNRLFQLILPKWSKTTEAHSTHGEKKKKKKKKIALLFQIFLQP